MLRYTGRRLLQMIPVFFGATLLIYAMVFLLPGDPVADINAIRQVAMVVKDGTVYFPTEAYEKLGIKPFTGVPAISGAGFVKP